MRTLIKGQRVKLADLADGSRFTLRVSLGGTPAPLLLLCFLLDERDGLIDAAHLLYAERRASPCGGVRVAEVNQSAQVFDIDFNAMSADAAKLAFALAFEDRANDGSGHAGQLRDGRFILAQGDQDLAEYAFAGSDFAFEKAVLLGEFYRKEGTWRLQIHGSGFRAGASALFSHYRAPADVLPELMAPASPRPTPAPSGPRPPGSGLRLPGVWPGGKPPALPQGILPAVGMVLVRDADGTGATGTGFAITPGGHLLTCHHVVENAVLIGFRAEGEERIRPARCLASDARHDLALLWLEDTMGCTSWLLPALPDQHPELGQELGLLAYPLGTHLGEGVTYSQGIINGLRQREGVAVLQIDTGAAPGSSGGPVFRRSDGRVIGVLQSALTHRDRSMIINLALDLRLFWELGWTMAPN
jgi:stress response protein SCP2